MVELKAVISNSSYKLLMGALKSSASVSPHSKELEKISNDLKDTSKTLNYK